MKLPFITPFDILSQVSPMGDTCLNKIVGNYYVETDHCLVRSGYNNHSLFFSEWQKPGPLDYIYRPDGYDFLLNGEKSLEFKSDYVETILDFNLIHVGGGIDSYLSRLKSKKRSEFKKLAGSAIVSTAITEPNLPQYADKGSNFIDQMLLQYLDDYYTAERGKDDTGWFGRGFYANKAPLNLMLYAGNFADHLTSRDMKRILLPIHNVHGEHICTTICLSDHHGKVLYALSDEDKNMDLYSAKEVTIANIYWACENGYSYVEIDNAIIDENMVDDPSTLVRVGYKNLFWTGVAQVPQYFSSESAMNIHINMREESTDE